MFIFQVSLYPYVCKWKKYPTGHPKCLIGPALIGTRVDQFVGLIRCTVLPPSTLYLPLLPAKINGKLVFTLCRTCAERQQQERCSHSEKARCLSGTWVSVELQKAEQLGYTVTAIHEVWHYSTTTQYDRATGEGGLFARYMDDFIVLKMENSGFPSDVVTDQEKHDFVRSVKESEGVTLDIHKIRKKNGARAVAKLCLNNLWGKLAQRSNMSHHRYVRSPSQLLDIMCSGKYQVFGAEFINEDCVYLTYKYTEGFEKPPPHTNAVVASFVTSYARLELYRYLEELGERVLYCDTDSVIYRSSPGETHPLLGTSMGCMSDELDGDFITEFTSNGAKTYGYRTEGGTRVMKCKGFTLNKITSDKITFSAMKDLATGDGTSSITVEGLDTIRRDPKRRKVYTSVENKTYKSTFDKRVMRQDHTSIPYGYTG